MSATEYEAQLKTFFDDVIKKAEEKAKVFLTEFVYEATNDLIDLTPLGDSVLYANWYRKRRKRMGLKEEAGLLANNYQITFNSMPGDFLRVYSEGVKGVEFLNQIQKMDSFKLGDSIYVMNRTPYIDEITVRGTEGEIFIDPQDWIDKTVKNQSAVMGYYAAASAAANNVNYSF